MISCFDVCEDGVLLQLILPVVSSWIYPMWIFVGFLGMIVANVFRRERFGYSIWKSILLTTLTEAYSIFGAWILYCLENTSKFPSRGFSFFGVLFFMPLFYYATCLFNFKKAYKVLNYVLLPVPLELAFIRIACTINGCCYGILSDCGIQYENVIRFPVQILEAFFDLTIFVGLLLYEKRGKLKINNLSLFFVLYSAVRFGCEFLRADPSVGLFGFRNGFVYSVFLFVVGLALVITEILYRRKKSNISA